MLTGYLSGLFLAVTTSAPAEGEVAPAKTPGTAAAGCRILGMPIHDRSRASKWCGDFAIFFQPEPLDTQLHLQPSAPGRGHEGEFTTTFGQGRFLMRFPLYLDGFYPPQRHEGNDAGTAVRGGLIEENVDDLGQPTIRVGSTTWAGVPHPAESGSRLSGVVGHLVISEHKLEMRLAILRTEANGLKIEIKFTGHDDTELGIPRMRRTAERSGEPIDMVGRKQADGEFLFVPAAEPRALQNIAAALLRTEWVDVPVRLKGEPSYTLTMELARPGKALIRRALKQWGHSE